MRAQGEEITPIPRIELLGMPLARLTPGGLLDHIRESLDRGRGGWVLTANLDKLQRWVTDAAMRELFSGADLIVADGIPLVWASRIQRTPLPGRVAGSDLVWTAADMLARSDRSLYLLGGSADAAARAARRFRERSPGLRIAGTASPQVSGEPTAAELAALRESLLRASPDLVYVALGAPKEERVIAALRDALPATWWIGVGISLSFVAGDVARAPNWMQWAGVEWLHRLAQEPRRLARRYLVHNLPFFVRLLARAWRARR